MSEILIHDFCWRTDWEDMGNIVVPGYILVPAIELKLTLFLNKSHLFKNCAKLSLKYTENTFIFDPCAMGQLPSSFGGILSSHLPKSPLTNLYCNWSHPSEIKQCKRYEWNTTEITLRNSMYNNHLLSIKYCLNKWLKKNYSIIFLLSYNLNLQWVSQISIFKSTAMTFLKNPSITMEVTSDKWVYSRPSNFFSQ